MSDSDGSSSDDRRSRRMQSGPHAEDDAAELNQPSPKMLKPAARIDQLPPELLKTILTLLDCRQLHEVRAGTIVRSCAMCIDSCSVLYSGKVHFPYIIFSTNAPTLPTYSCIAALSYQFHSPRRKSVMITTTLLKMSQRDFALFRLCINNK